MHSERLLVSHVISPENADLRTITVRKHQDSDYTHSQPCIGFSGTCTRPVPIIDDAVIMRQLPYFRIKIKSFLGF